MFIELLILSFVAAFFGTIVMTVGQEIEIRIKKRPISYTLAIAIFKILRLDFNKLNKGMKIVSSYIVHFAYGTALGFPLAFFEYFGFMDFYIVLIVYFLIVWIQGLIVVPLLGIAGSPWTWGLKPVLTEMVHKFVYSIATLIIFTSLVI
ncbi:MAG: hypothetical protein QF858_01635 [Candidatus Pacebacteria bacterium]|jgi:hypothetical protein|nr:hypothetical protein [bacterium]MDP6527565.1 hypothetical protein [Candidatus Paceibacterota bacterium]MDP6659827.1 hypothetical protein [Candidatus Paceibacterota bacterium]|tara:strand:- start:45697 stop:46143 length:447 start_codon:yes stop_codon:yes gene_type:complete